MTRKRKFKDGILNAMTYLASGISVLVLIAVFGFVVYKGKDTLSWEMLRNNYWSQNYLVEFTQTEPGTFTRPDSLDETIYFSEQYGIGLQDVINHEKKRLVVVAYIDENSPLKASVDATAGTNYQTPLSIAIDSQIEKLDYVNADGVETFTGSVMSETAEQIIANLDQAQEVKSLYFRTPGGGIWGSLIATLLLIFISLAISLPLGIFAAVYLNEIATAGPIRNFIERSIEMLAGVPSIVFGLMGIVVLFPVTALFKVEGLSILLGGMTMSVVLLPVIIRSVQESLLVVPPDYRSASLSLGATKTQTIFKVILPSALPGILSALLLAISRIIGESAALIYTMGTFINDSPALTQGATSLAVHIWSIMSQDQPNFELASAISIIILLVVLVLNLIIKFFSSRMNRKLGI